MEFVSHVLKVCLLNTLGWEEIDAILTSQEAGRGSITHGHVGDVAKQVSRK